MYVSHVCACYMHVHTYVLQAHDQIANMWKELENLRMMVDESKQSLPTNDQTVSYVSISCATLPPLLTTPSSLNHTLLS